MKYSTSIQEITTPGAQSLGQFLVVGSIPPTCYDDAAGRSIIYPTEADALTAILADPWIRANPGHTVQRADCSVLPSPGELASGISCGRASGRGELAPSELHGQRVRGRLKAFRVCLSGIRADIDTGSVVTPCIVETVHVI